MQSPSLPPFLSFPLPAVRIHKRVKIREGKRGMDGFAYEIRGAFKPWNSERVANLPLHVNSLLNDRKKCWSNSNAQSFKGLSSSFQEHLTRHMTYNKKPDLSLGRHRGSPSPPLPSCICIFVSDNISKADVQIYRVRQPEGWPKMWRGQGASAYVNDWLPLIVLRAAVSARSSLHIKLLACV